MTTNEQRWTVQFGLAMENIDSAFVTLETLQREVDEAAESYDPSGNPDGESNLEILRATAEDLERLRDQTELGNMKSNLVLGEDEIKHNLEWIQEGRHNDGRPKPVVKLKQFPNHREVMERGQKALEAVGREKECPKLSRELELARTDEETDNLVKRWFQVIQDEPQTKTAVH